jgi:alkaline phosphatase D
MDKLEFMLKRRKFLSSFALGAAATSMATPWAGSAIAATPKFVNYPFSMGVASGDPTPEGFVLWTRLAPNPFEIEPFTNELVEVLVEIAEDDKFTKIIHRQTEFARPDTMHSVHAEIYGLPAGRTYFYRFRVGTIASPVGRTATAPMFAGQLDKLKCAWVSCSHYEQGYFSAYRDIAEQNPDLILELGDYIYEVSWGPQLRRMPVNEATTLDEYRLIHSVNKLDKDLQAAHAIAPWLFIWDDHEVSNDYQGDVGSVLAGQDEKQFVARKAASYRAYFENLPLRARSRFDAINRMRLYGQSTYGNLVEFTLLDTRQYRPRAACASPGKYNAEMVSRATCAELADKSRSILGSAQERFVNDNFMRGNTKWSILVQPTLFGTLFQKNDKGEGLVYNESWSGFEPARQKIIDAMARRQKQSSCVVIGGDMHAFFAADVKKDYNDPNSETVAVEFVGGAVTSKSFSYDRFMKMMPENPHLKFFDDRTNGYGLIEISDKKMDVKLRHTKSTWNKSAGFSNLKHYVIERGINKLNEA